MYLSQEVKFPMNVFVTGGEVLNVFVTGGEVLNVFVTGDEVPSECVCHRR